MVIFKKTSDNKHVDLMTDEYEPMFSVEIFKRSLPSKFITPAFMTAGGEDKSFMIASAETVFPEPLSPRIASVSPLFT